MHRFPLLRYSRVSCPWRWAPLALLLAACPTPGPGPDPDGDSPEPAVYLSQERVAELRARLVSGDDFKAAEAVTLLFQAHHDPAVREVLRDILERGDPPSAVEAVLVSIRESHAMQGVVHLAGILEYVEAPAPLGPRARGALEAMPRAALLEALGETLRGAAADAPARRRVARTYGLLEALEPARDGTLIALVDPERERDPGVRDAAQEALERLTYFRYGQDAKQWRRWRERYGAMSELAYRGVVVQELQAQIAARDAAYERIVSELLRPANVAQNLDLLAAPSAAGPEPGSAGSAPLKVRQAALRNLHAALRGEAPLTPEQKGEVMAAVTRQLQAPEAVLREQAAGVLGSLKDPAALAPLIRRLAMERDGAVLIALVQAAHGVVVNLAPAAVTEDLKPTLAALAAALHDQLQAARPLDKNAAVARPLLTSLGAVGRWTGPRPLARTGGEGADPTTSSAALNLVETLIAAGGESTNTDVQSAVFAALADVLGPDTDSADWNRAGAWLVKVIADERQPALARQHALAALGRLRYGPGRAALVTLLDQPQLAPSLQGAVIAALGELGELGDNRELVDRFLAFYRQGDPLRGKVVAALANLLRLRPHHAADVIERLRAGGGLTAREDAVALAAAAVAASDAAPNLLEPPERARLKRLHVTLALDLPAWEGALLLLEQYLAQPKVYEAEALRALVRQAYGNGPPDRGPRTLAKVQALLAGQERPVLPPAELWREVEPVLGALREAGDVGRYTRLVVHSAVRVTAFPAGVAAPGAAELKALPDGARDAAQTVLIELLADLDGSVAAKARAVLAETVAPPPSADLTRRLLAVLDHERRAPAEGAYLLLARWYAERGLAAPPDQPAQRTYVWQEDSAARAKAADRVRALLGVPRE